MWPGVLCLLLAQLVSGHTPANIYRYPAYTGCNAVAGSVTFHAANGTQQMIVALSSLPPNATGYIEIHNGVNCFDQRTINAIWQRNLEEYTFEANEYGNVTANLAYGNVTVDSLMGRSVIIILETDNVTTRIGCGTVGTSYPASLEPYPAITNTVRGSIAVTGPLAAANISEAAHGATVLQLAYAFNGLPANSSGSVQVYDGSSCRNVSAIGAVFGSNWTSNYTADAAGNAIGNADITHVVPARGVRDYWQRAVVISDAAGTPLACAVLQCPTGSIEEGQTGGQNTQLGRCIPQASSWVSSTVVAGDFYSGQTTPLQVQVSGVNFELGYPQVRSYPACAEQGRSVGTTFFLRRPSNVEGVLGGQFVPVPGQRQIVAFGDRQPESVGRQDNWANVSFIQSVQTNTHDVVHLVVGIETVIFRVAAAGHRSEVRLDFQRAARVSFPTSANAINTTVWVTNAATNAVIYQRQFLFGRNSPNFVWFLYGWDKSAADCTTRQKNCGNFPISVTQWPEVREDYGPGVIPPVTQYSSAFFSAPSMIFAFCAVALF